MALIHPKTNDFAEVLPKFQFTRSSELQLWVLPFFLKDKRLLLPGEGFPAVFRS